MKYSMEALGKSLLLYAVTDRQWLKGCSLESQIELALQGGCTMIQLREKSLSEDEFTAEARSVAQLCHRYNVPLIINDNVSIAKAIDADGVHVGQGDMSPTEVRRILGADKIVGVSARTIEQAVLAEQQGASYLGVGAVFGTTTKGDAKPINLETLRSICESVSIPVVAIGGITSDNILQLSKTGISGVAVVSGIFAASDIISASRHLRQLAEKVVGL